MSKKLKLSEIKLNSFVTKEVKGGNTPYTYLGHDCSYQPDCNTAFGNACGGGGTTVTDNWRCESLKVCFTDHRGKCYPY